MARATKKTNKSATKKTPAKATAKSSIAKAKATVTAAAATTAAAIKKPAARKTSTTKQPVKAPEPVIVVSHDIIAAKAYEIWLKKGRPTGNDEANWREAESELCSAA